MIFSWEYFQTFHSIDSMTLLTKGQTLWNFDQISVILVSTTSSTNRQLRCVRVRSTKTEPAMSIPAKNISKTCVITRKHSTRPTNPVWCLYTTCPFSAPSNSSRWYVNEAKIFRLAQLFDGSKCQLVDSNINCHYVTSDAINLHQNGTCRVESLIWDADESGE